MKKEFNFKEAKRVGLKFQNKEIKVSITTRLDTKVIAWLRNESEKKGIPYQTLINSLLVEAMNTTHQEETIRRLIREELDKKAM